MPHPDLINQQACFYHLKAMRSAMHCISLHLFPKIVSSMLFCECQEDDRVKSMLCLSFGVPSMSVCKACPLFARYRS